MRFVIFEKIYFDRKLIHCTTVIKQCYKEMSLKTIVAAVTINVCFISSYLLEINCHKKHEKDNV